MTGRDVILARPDVTSQSLDSDGASRTRTGGLMVGAQASPGVLVDNQRVDRDGTRWARWVPGRRRITAPALPPPHGNGITTRLLSHVALTGTSPSRPLKGAVSRRPGPRSLRSRRASRPGGTGRTGRTRWARRDGGAAVTRGARLSLRLGL